MIWREAFGLSIVDLREAFEHVDAKNEPQPTFDAFILPLMTR